MSYFKWKNRSCHQNYLNARLCIQLGEDPLVSLIHLSSVGAGFVLSFPRCWEVTHMARQYDHWSAVTCSLHLCVSAIMLLPAKWRLLSLVLSLTPGLSLGLGFSSKAPACYRLCPCSARSAAPEPCSCLVVALSVLLQFLWLSWSSYGVISVLLADSGTAVCKNRSHRSPADSPATRS